MCVGVLRFLSSVWRNKEKGISFSFRWCDDIIADVIKTTAAVLLVPPSSTPSPLHSWWCSSQFGEEPITKTGTNMYTTAKPTHQFHFRACNLCCIASKFNIQVFYNCFNEFGMCVCVCWRSHCELDRVSEGKCRERPSQIESGREWRVKESRQTEIKRAQQFELISIIDLNDCFKMLRQFSKCFKVCLNGQL